MTNRDYMMGLSNGKLAELMAGDRICDYIETCHGLDCTKCITKWLETERKSDLEKGQIRQADSERCYLILMVTDTKCLIISEKGTIFRRLKSVVDTWAIRTDISIDEFVERIFNNL